MHLCCVCTGNTCRSPMLAALLRRALEARTIMAEVDSAGVAATRGIAASPHACTAMDEYGIDLATHRSRPIDDIDLTTVDRWLCMSGNHALALIQAGVPVERIVILNEAGGGIPDPFGGTLDHYRRTAELLAVEAERLGEELRPPSDNDTANGT